MNATEFDPTEVSNVVDIRDARAIIESLRSRLDAAEGALRDISDIQPKTLAMIRRNGFKFEDIGAVPGNWQHLAFSIYSELCGIDSIARAALANPTDEPAFVQDRPMTEAEYRAAAPQEPEPRGSCSYCGRNFALRKGGLVRDHLLNAARCHGSGTLPTQEPEPRCPNCGTTFDEPFQLVCADPFHAASPEPTTPEDIDKEIVRLRKLERAAHRTIKGEAEE